MDFTVPQDLRYSAFISYSHHDAAFARRLHRRLETYRLPRRLRQSDARCDGSGHLRPIFRDREEFSASADLTTAVRDALSEASYLIVVCSRHAQGSVWVAREVALFRELHGNGEILAALIEGATEESLPSMLGQQKAGRTGFEPLAADFRKQGDGTRLALLKLVAALARVRLDQLVQRDAQRRVRRVAAAAAASLAGLVAMGALAVVAVNARDKAERERVRGETLVEYLLTDLRHRLKGVGRLDVLDIVNQGALAYYQGQDLRHLPQAALLQRAKLLQAIAEDDEERGDLSGAQEQAREAGRTTNLLIRASPDDRQVIFAQAQSDYWEGFICWRMADDACARTHFVEYAKYARHLQKLDPKNPDWLLETGYADSNLGMFALRTSIDTTRADRLFSLALAYFKAAAVYRPEDHDIQFMIADGYAWLADVYRVEGAFDSALIYRLMQRHLLEQILTQDPRDFESRRALAYNDFAIARIEMAQGKLQDAVTKLITAYQSASILHDEVPENQSVVAQLRLFELFRARAWISMSDIDRPPLATIFKITGDCSAEKTKPHNEELYAFCLAVRARILAVTDSDAARSLLSRIPAVPPAGDRLTERWLLDLREESRL